MKTSTHVTDGTCRLIIDNGARTTCDTVGAKRGSVREHSGGYARRSFAVLTSVDCCLASKCNHFKDRYHTKRLGHRGAVGGEWPDPYGSKDRNPNQNPCGLPERNCWIEWEDPWSVPYSFPCPWSVMWQKVVGRRGVNRAPILASILRVGRHILLHNKTVSIRLLLLM